MQVAHIGHGARTSRRQGDARGDGGGIEIMIDVNMGWDADTRHQAVIASMIRSLLVEEPVVAEDFAGYRRMPRRCARAWLRREPLHAQ